MRGGNTCTALVGVAWAPDCVLWAVELVPSWVRLPEVLAMGHRGCCMALVGWNHWGLPLHLKSKVPEGDIYGWVLSCLHTTWTRVHSSSSRASQQGSTLEFIVTRWDMSLLQSGGCKGAGHTLALTLTGCTKVGRQLNRQAGIHGKLSTKKGAQGQNLSNCLCFPAREGCLWYTRERRVVLVQWLHPVCYWGQGCLCVCCIFLAPHSPSTTLFGDPDLLIQCRKTSAIPFPPPWQREFPNHTDAHGLVGTMLWCQSRVTLQSWSWLSSEPIPGCQVVVFQRGKASF